MKDGILIVNKPKGMTSHDVVDKVRQALRMKQVGHSGTLDPLASGVLVILVGRATKLFKNFLNYDKEYNATLTLGRITDTGDSCGKVIKDVEVGVIVQKDVEDVLQGFIGEIQQVPPMVSAIRYKGKRLYQFAREGIEVPRLPRRIIIRELKLLHFSIPEIKLYIRCSTGTYIRQLACDIAERLGCGGHISQIERESVGPYRMQESITLEQVHESYIRAWQQ